MQGAAPDAPKTADGKETYIPYRFDLLPLDATVQVAATLAEGAKTYGRDAWKNLPQDTHINHALMHIFAFLEGDKTDDHLVHAVCRLMFACDHGYE